MGAFKLSIFAIFIVFISTLYHQHRHQHLLLLILILFLLFLKFKYVITRYSNPILDHNTTLCFLLLQDTIFPPTNSW